MNTGLPAGELGPLAVALVAAFVSGWFAAWFLVGYLRTRSLRPFVAYRLLLALAIFALVSLGPDWGPDLQKRKRVDGWPRTKVTITSEAGLLPTRAS